MKSILVKVNDDLKNTIKWVYATEELQDFYKSKKMLDFKRKASMYSGGGDLSLIFGKYPVTEEEQTAIDIFLMKKVTKKIAMDTVALTLWLLQRHYGDGKLGWDQELITFHTKHDFDVLVILCTALITIVLSLCFWYACVHN